MNGCRGFNHQGDNTTAGQSHELQPRLQSEHAPYAPCTTFDGSSPAEPYQAGAMLAAETSSALAILLWTPQWYHFTFLAL